MNTFKIIFAALAATAVLAGCAKEITSPSSENDKVTPDAEGSRVIAVSFAPQTKTEIDGFQPKFVDNDSILISNGVAIDTCDVEVEGNVATISTNLTGPLTAVYPYKAAGMSDSNPNQIDTVLVSTEQDGTFASANICMARMTDENEESLSFENKTAVFCIKPAAGASSEYVEVKAEGFNIANDYPEGSTFTTCNTIHVAHINTDSVYVSILVPDGLTVGDLKFSDGTKEKTITTGAKATEDIAAGTLYTVTEAEWKSPEADIPDGALNGVFTVNAQGKQVHFSRGNLYAKNEGTTESPDWKWHFYDKQYNFLAANMDVSGSTNNPQRSVGANEIEIDLFTWGYNATYSVKPTGTEYVSGHDTEGDKQLNPSTGGDDWGVAYCGSNGIDVGTWRTLSTEEWQYLFNNHVKVWGQCNSVNGYFIAPDGYEGNATALTSAVTDWASAEAAGIVFLPAAGHRNGSSVGNVGDRVRCWSSTAHGNDASYDVFFDSNSATPVRSDFRSRGYSVRLVTDVPAAPTPTPAAPEGFVDLGVKNDENEPLYWAECNLGATNAWDYGKYFSWGDFTGQTPTNNTFSEAFSWDNDVFGQTFDKVLQDTACPNDILAPAYDAATQADPNHNWRTPTDDEFVALAANCVWGWCDGDTAKYKGTTVPGYIVYKAKNENDKGKAYIDNTWMRWDTSQLQFVTDGASEATGYDPSDTHIFFPAAGHGNGTNLLNAGSNGYYWSSSLDTDNHSNAYQLYFSSDDFVNPQDVDRRCHGFSVRPVSD